MKLYGHLFSSYTWKALIPLYANGTAFEFRDVETPENMQFVHSASPQGKFPVLADGAATLFEATSIVEYLALHHPGPAPLIPADPGAAQQARMIDRVFDNYVMSVVQECVGEKLRTGELSAATRADATARLDRSYRWLDTWLADYDLTGEVSLIECAAAPSLFYADWVSEIPAEYARLRAYRAHLLALPAVKRCVDDARPYRHYFPLGAPDRD